MFDILVFTAFGALAVKAIISERLLETPIHHLIITIVLNTIVLIGLLKDLAH